MYSKNYKKKEGANNKGSNGPPPERGNGPKPYSEFNRNFGASSQEAYELRGFYHHAPPRKSYPEQNQGSSEVSLKKRSSSSKNYKKSDKGQDNCLNSDSSSK